MQYLKVLAGLKMHIESIMLAKSLAGPRRRAEVGSDGYGPFFENMVDDVQSGASW